METPVADEDSKASGPFDVTAVRALVALMSRHDLSEIDLRHGEQRIRLRRGALKTSVTTLPQLAAVPVPPPTSASPSNAAASNTPQAPQKKLIEIKSPTPGTFYARPSPDAEAFVKVGSRVEAKTVVCLIEAMKLYTEIQAECSGIITEILVENAQPVEFDQVLFRVDPTA
jgi:acetyl-CoA carboxylase biotin carboxyl carrier protein